MQPALLTMRILVGACMAAALSVALAQPEYPARPVRFIVGLAPGGTTDTAARKDPVPRLTRP